ncbi:MAG: flagellar biosynthesis anti-sigma factor FlgM [Oscillospiraceae bacterium]|jgi:flagellar biosynthesis anti-sigma factor FlgM|nr:flagellar biosynthesis anti-sigma factor FlgM [Oscillospiraceae bacterium]
MKINPLAKPGIIQSYQAHNKKVSNSGSSYHGGSDQVSFSDDALKFSQIMKLVRDNMESGEAARSQRLEEIKSGIADGSYKIKSDVVAESILRVLSDS